MQGSERRENSAPYKSKDLSTPTPTQREKEEKEKAVEYKKGSSSFGQQKKHWLCS